MFFMPIVVRGFALLHSNHCALGTDRYDEEGEAVIHGFREGTDCEVLFELQNFTEVGPGGFCAQELHIGLCGLAYRARAPSENENTLDAA